jgi:tyrosine-protein kinase
MKAQSDHLNLEAVVAVLRRRWRVIILLTVLAGAASFVLSKQQRKQYTATASVVFQDPGVSQQASGVQPTATPADDPQIIATHLQELVQQPAAASSTAAIVGRGLTASQVSQAIAVSEQGQTEVANLSATSPSPIMAADIANTYVKQFIAHQRAQDQASIAQAVRYVDRQIAALSPQQLAGPTGQGLLDRAESLRVLATLQTGGAKLLASAPPPIAPSSPKVARNTALGLLLGLLLGLTIAFLREQLDRRMKNVDDLEATYKLPLLAAVPGRKSYALPPHARGPGKHGDKEVFRLLRAYLRYFNVDRELRTLLIVSAAPGDGKTTVARNLAEAAQETGTKTLLLEADLRRPTMATHYGVPSTPGLSDLLISRAQPAQAIRRIPLVPRANGATSEISLDLLVAGHPAPNPAELIESRAMADILSQATELYELVVIDTPPLAAVSDAISLLRKVDGVVVVSELGKNTRDAAAFLRERLADVNAPLLGIVANRVNVKGETGYGYGYRGDYGAAARTPRAAQQFSANH